MQQWIYSPLTSSEVTSKVAAADRSNTRLRKTKSINWVGLQYKFTHLSNFLQGRLCTDPLPSILVQTFWNGFYGKGSSLRRAPWMITTSLEYFFISRSSARDVDQATNSTRLHKREATWVITLARQRTPSHHVSLQSRDAMTSIPAFWHYATELRTGSPGKALSRYCNLMTGEKRFLAVDTNGWGVSLASPSKSLLSPWQSFSWLSWIFFSSFDSCSSWSCSAPPVSHDPALRGDFRNPHSLNSTYLHQRWKDGNKSYPSRDKDCPDTSMAGASA